MIDFELDYNPDEFDTMGLILELVDFIRARRKDLRLYRIEDNLVVFRHADPEKRVQYKFELRVVKSKFGFYLGESGYIAKLMMEEKAKKEAEEKNDKD